MFSQFSAKAIQAIHLAREAAKRLEFNEVDSAHLLLGLIEEENGVAARALRLAGVELRQARFAVEQIWGRGYVPVLESELAFAPECMKLFNDALDVAAQTEPFLVDTQDLLLVLLKSKECRAASVLRQLSIPQDRLYQQLMQVRTLDLANPTPPPENATVLPKHFSPRLLTEEGHQVYDIAFSTATFFGHNLVGTEQILVGLLAVQGTAAAGILTQNGLTRLDVEAVAHQFIGQGSGTVSEQVVLSHLAETVFEYAWEEARRRHHSQVGTMHILMGLLQLDTGGALHIMDQLKVNLASIQLDADQVFIEHPRDPEPPQLEY
ncbi:MAG: Clp protease N-terminal domain-containing protein [Bacteroidota bacterium]